MSVIDEENESTSEAKAARIIQRKYREYTMSKCSLTEEEKNFIRPWYKRWRNKSIFQVLLLYRAERLQVLVNFCLQIHLYNQTALNEIHKTKNGINLSNLDKNAKPAEYLPPLKAPIPKLPFTWETFILRGATDNCEPLPDCNVEELAAQVYENLRGKRNEKEEIINKNYEDKEIQTSPNKESATLSKETEGKQIEEQKDKLNEFESLRVEKQTEKDSSNKIEVEKQLKTTITTENTQQKLIPQPRDSTSVPIAKPRTNTKGSLISERKFQIPINEMEEKFKNKNYKEEGDDPPFNFRALLRKTHHVPQTRKTSHEDLLFQKEIASFNFSERKKSLTCGNFSKLPPSSDTIINEWLPGVLVYGKVTDL